MNLRAMVNEIYDFHANGPNRKAYFAHAMICLAALYADTLSKEWKQISENSLKAYEIYMEEHYEFKA